MYRKKKNNIYRIWYYLQNQVSTGGLGIYPVWIRGATTFVDRNTWIMADNNNTI